MIKKPLLVCEIAKEHKGSKEKAIAMIESAYKAGFDVVKLQAYNREDIDENHKNYRRYWNSHLNLTEMDFIARYVKFNTKMQFWCSVFNKSLITPLAEFSDTVKIPSTFFAMKNYVRDCINTFQNIHLSTGMHSDVTIKALLEDYRHYANQKGKNLVPYHCVSQYPTLYKDLRLSSITDFNLKGFSYHGNLILPVLLAMTMGAEYIELHYTIDEDPNKWQWTHDMVVRLKKHIDDTMEAMLLKDLPPDEQANLLFFKTEFVDVK